MAYIYYPPMQEIVFGDIHTYIQPAPLKWTTTPPNKPGWYWCWNGEGQPSIENVFWDEFEKAWAIYANNGEFPDPMPRGCHWLGPVPPPEPPKV